MESGKEDHDPVQGTGGVADDDCAIKAVKVISADDRPPVDGGGGDIISYSSEELNAMRTSPLASKWPPFLDEAYKNARTGNWDPDIWHQKSKPEGIKFEGGDLKRKEDRPNSAAAAADNKKALKDPKDRLKADEGGASAGGGGLVLGPQRRSFNTGCQMVTAAPSNNDKEGKDADNNTGGGRLREIREMKERVQAARRGDEGRPDNRRVGSGRVLNRGGGGGGGGYSSEDRPYGGGGGGSNDARSEYFRRGRNSNSMADNDDNDGGGGGGRYDDRRDGRSGGGGGNWFDRRNNDRYNSESNDDGGYRRGGGGLRRNEHDQRGGRFGGDGGNDRRRRGDGRDHFIAGNGRDHRHHRRSETEEPEWMSESVNQDELMELRGFDDSPEKEPSGQSKVVGMDNKREKKQAVDKEGVKQPGANNVEDNVSGNDYLGEILHLESIPGLANLLNDDPSHADGEDEPRPETGPAAGGGSRFSQFFQREQQQPPAKSSARSNEPAKQFGQQQQPALRIPSPGDPGACFAPISPAAATRSAKNSGDCSGGGGPAAAAHPPAPAALQPPPAASNPLMDMLRGGRPVDAETGGLPNMPPDLAHLQGKNVMSVEELEADLNKQQQFRKFPSGGSSDGGKQHRPNHHQQQKMPSSGQDEDMSAFNKLAAMLEMNQQNGGSKQQVPPSHPLGNFGMRPPPNPLVRPMPMPPPHGHMTEEELLRQQQLRPPMPPPPPPPTGHIGPPDEASIRQGMLGLIYQAPLNVDILRGPEAQSLQTVIEQGQVHPNVLLHQFIHGNLAKQQREVLLNVLKVVQNRGGLGPVPPPPAAAAHRPPPAHQAQPPPPPPHPHPQGFSRPKSASPLSGGPDPQLLMQQMMHPGPQQRSPPTSQQHHQQQQQRGVGGGSMSNTLAVSPLPIAPGRVPSPQDLVKHTQQIMQNALIKKKLKEQEESYRKKMGDTTKEPPNPSPTSLAFAPTVVMKKLAAERRDSDPKLQQAADKTAAVPSALVGGGGGPPPGPHGDGGNDNSGGRISPARLMDQIRSAQQAHHQIPPVPPLGPHMAGPPMPPQIGPLNPHMLQQRAMFDQMIRSDQLKMLQAQQQMQAMVDPRFMRPRHPSGGPMGWGGSRGPSPASAMMSSGPPLANMHPMGPPGAMGPGGAGLARFFSPEVLAQANAGNAPTMPPLPTQKVLTLEEIERQAAAVRI